MEQMVRRSQAALAIQGYFETKQIQYGIHVARAAVNLTDQTLEQVERRLLQKQAFEVEIIQSRVAASRARLLLADLQKSYRIQQRNLAVTLHQSRLLVPQTKPVPIALDVMFAAQLQQQGVAPGYVMLFAMTLGTYSIIPTIYLWREVSRRLAVLLFAFFVLLGWIVGLVF